MKKQVTFITTNKHKFKEAQKVLIEYGITLEQLDREYDENHDASLEEIAQTAAQKLSQELQTTVIVEDTGLFFDAYPGFPGALPKFVFNTLGYEGIFRVLTDQKRTAYFKTMVAFCRPNEKAQLFEGRMDGTITEEVHNSEKDAMPYDRIFIPKGETRTISDMTLEKKNSFSQRAQAFRALGDYLTTEPQSVE